MKISIGLDISKNFVDSSTFDGKRHYCKHYKGNNDNVAKRIYNDIVKYKKMNKEVDNSLVLMESTGNYHITIAEKLCKLGANVSVQNPSKIKKFGEALLSRTKTDKADSKLIAKFGYTMNPEKYILRNTENKEIIYILKVIEDHNSTRTAYLNRLEAYKQDKNGTDISIKFLIKIIKFIEEEIKNLEIELNKLVKAHFEEQYKLLTSISGVGIKVATGIIGFFNEFENFDNAKKVQSFLGINSTIKESGKSVKGKGTISKRGNGYLRSILYMAALSASRHNSQCKELYDRLLAKGKPKKLALVAVMNKLTRQIFAVLKYKVKYDPNYLKKFNDNKLNKPNKC